MKLTLTALMLALSIGTTYAYSTYDPSTGNRYTVNPYPNGGAHIYGNNTNTGSQWNTTVDPQGNMRGTDSSGSYWMYNNSNGYYYNSGTGKSCIGKGYARTCT